MLDNYNPWGTGMVSNPNLYLTIPMAHGFINYIVNWLGICITHGHTNPGTAVFTWTYKSWHGSIYMDIQILARQYLHGHTNPGMAVFTGNQQQTI